MLKSLSAALIAVTMIAAPAMAAGPAKADKAVATPVKQVKSNPRDAQARMVRHHHRHVRPHHRFHHKMGMNKTFKHTAKVTRATASHVKRG
jgi:hypothetical protein